MQIYHRDCHATRTRPDRELVAFRKVRLDPGAERTLDITIPAERLGYRSGDLHFRQEPGRHEFFVTTGADPEGGEAIAVVVE